MLQLQKRITAVLAACLTWGAVIAPVNAAVGANPALGRDVIATLTAKHGTVFKRDFRDWNREEWGEPESAQIADVLREGMQIGTGKDSWAEVTWPNVKTRAWENTVFAVAPNKRLVYLTGGEMLFRLDKNRKDKEEYYVWTKVLQARIRGTTVLVQAKGPVTRFTVMEGVVEVTNRLDKSRVTLKPGVVYEIKGLNMSTRSPMPQLNGAQTPSSQPEPYKPTPMKAPDLTTFGDITYDANSPTPLFQDKNATTNLYASNSVAIKNHPLVSMGNQTIDSVDLINQQQDSLPGYNRLLPIKLAAADQLSKQLAASVSIAAVPSNATYYIGPTVGTQIKLPQAAYQYLQPNGQILVPSKQAPAATTALLGGPKAVPVMPGFTGLLSQPAGEEVPQPQQSPSAIFNEDTTPYPVQDYAQPAASGLGDALQSSNVPSMLPNSCLTPTGNGAVTTNSAFQPIQTALPPNPIPNINGIISGGSTTFTAPGAVAPVSNAVGVAGGGLGTVVSPVAQPLAPVVNSGGNAVNGLNNALNNALNNTLNLGH